MSPKGILHLLLMDLNQRLKVNDLHWPSGICSNLDWSILSDEDKSQCDLARDLLDDLLRVWPEGTGHHGYPVPGDAGDLSRDTAMEAYYNSDQCNWDPETWYGQMRRKLLVWLIEQTEPETEDE